MTTMELLRRCLIVLCIASGSIAFAEEEQLNPLRPTDEVVKAVSPIESSPYSSRLNRIVMALSTGQASSITPVTNDYESFGKGLWGIRSVSKQGSRALEAHSVSVCGLIELVGTSNSNVSYETAISIPVGGAFVPFGLKGHIAGTMNSRATRLLVKSGPERLCNPLPGDALKYEVQSESSILHTASYAGSSSRASTNIFRWECAVGAPKPISELVAAQEGTYLPVTCSGVNDSSTLSVSAEYAFFQQFGIYLNLRRAGGAFSSTTKISSLEYE